MLLHAEIIDKVHIDKSFNYSLKRDGRSKLGQDRMEIQANQFAAELLMPTKFLQGEFKSGYLDFENGSEALAKKYGVSVQAMSYKIMDVFPFADAC
jgi:Zn-dependent peptidase ImmA (M78 family)